MTAKEEIAYLFAYLGSSGCEFNRNGTWYKSSRAVNHLNRKYEYMLRKGWKPDAEDFIELAASQSSFSGKPYLVKCADEPAIASGVWLRAELIRLRAQREGLSGGVRSTQPTGRASDKRR